MSLHMYHIEIVKQSACKDAQYIGRPSPLGNPFPMSKHASRDDVCDKYHDWFHKQIINNDKLICHELTRLHAMGRINGVVRLGCYCHPLRCHGETIKDFMTDNQDLLEEWYQQIHVAA